MSDGIIFNIMKYAIHDGPGIRTTVFFKGCPLSCLWCHNPESQENQPQLYFIKNRCISCLDCASYGAIGSGEQNCTACGRCAKICPTGARVIMGRLISAEALTTEILKDDIFYRQSGGGVTFSGGEPFFQPQFLEKALEGCKKADIHTAVDTSGYAPASLLLKCAPLIDLFLYDLKMIDEKKHIRLTGRSNSMILENLKILHQSGKKIWLRFPVLPGINDGAEDLERLADFILSVGEFERICLLPYHNISEEKYRRLGKEYPLNQTVKPPERESMDSIAAGFAKKGLNVQVGA